MMRLKALEKSGPPTIARLYLARHGQVADGHAHRYHGHNDIGLSRQGVRQLKDLAVQLENVPLAGVYASDLSRAWRGAQILSRDRELTPEAVPEFREINFGVWEGLSFEEIAARYPEDLRARFQDLAGFRIPGGESLMTVRARVLPKLKELVERHAGQAFAVVAHAGVNRIILSDALEMDLSRLFHLDQNYGCLNIIDYFPDLALVRLLNGGVNGLAG